MKSYLAARDNQPTWAIVRPPLSPFDHATQDELLDLAKASQKIAGYVEGKEMVKEIVVPGKLVNLVVR